MDIRIETEQEVDGRWIAEAPDLPGVLAYGKTEAEARAAALELAAKVLREKAEAGEQ